MYKIISAPSRIYQELNEEEICQWDLVNCLPLSSSVTHDCILAVSFLVFKRVLTLERIFREFVSVFDNHKLQNSEDYL